ncbi:MAG: endo-1,3-alpha-glucanase family glycosylhydrolase [Gaiellaceae bacterium]
MLLCTTAAAGGSTVDPALGVASQRAVPTPIFAYYTIDHTSQGWSQSRGDLPLLGRYASDEHDVILSHITSAKAAGIAGFLVRWKSNRTLDARLTQLVDLAAQNDFKLGIAYDASKVDGSRVHPRRVRRDLDRFIDGFASSTAFDSFARPLVIWSGTENYSRSQVARTTRERRDSLLILASESTVAGVTRLGRTVAGNAHEWSSLDPQRKRGFALKFAAMGDAVRANGGIWIPGVSPGFEAVRPDGGSDVTPRRAGETLMLRLSGAQRSDPDVIGLASWNDFARGTYVEPSQLFGQQYLELLASTRGSEASLSAAANGGTEETRAGTRLNGTVLLGAVLLVGVFVLLAAARRGWRERSGPRPVEADYVTTVRSL